MSPLRHVVFRNKPARLPAQVMEEFTRGRATSLLKTPHKWQEADETLFHQTPVSWSGRQRNWHGHPLCDGDDEPITPAA